MSSYRRPGVSTNDPQETRRLTTIIQANLSDGKLPYNSIPRIWGGPGNGEACDVCETLVTKDELVMEGIATDGGGAQFHVKCFYLWDALRKVAPTQVHA